MASPRRAASRGAVAASQRRRRAPRHDPAECRRHSRPRRRPRGRQQPRDYEMSPSRVRVRGEPPPRRRLLRPRRLRAPARARVVRSRHSSTSAVPARAIRPPITTPARVDSTKPDPRTDSLGGLNELRRAPLSSAGNSAGSCASRRLLRQQRSPVSGASLKRTKGLEPADGFRRREATARLQALSACV